MAKLKVKFSIIPLTFPRRSQAYLLIICQFSFPGAMKEKGSLDGRQGFVKSQRFSHKARAACKRISAKMN